MQLIDVSSACIHDVVASSDAVLPLSYGKVCLLMALPQPFTLFFSFPGSAKSNLQFVINGICLTIQVTMAF